MTTNLYILRTDSKKELSIFITTEEEVSEIVKSQQNNQFIREDEKQIYEKICSISNVQNCLHLIDYNKQYSSFGISENAQCKDLDWSFLKKLKFSNFSVHNPYVLNSSIFPTIKCVVELIIGKSVQGYIDLSRLPNLTSVIVLEWNKKIEFHGENNISKIIIGGFNSNNQVAFSPLHIFKNVKEIVINKMNCSDLDGIEFFHSLSRLEINYGVKLKDIGELKKLEKLTEITFFVCKKIKNFSALIGAKKLLSLTIVDCGKIESIKFIKKIVPLDQFVMLKTTVLDGDLSAQDKFLTKRG